MFLYGLRKNILLLKLNKLFKNPDGVSGKCVVTKLKTGFPYEKFDFFRDTWFSQDSATTRTMIL